MKKQTLLFLIAAGATVLFTAFYIGLNAYAFSNRKPSTSTGARIAANGPTTPSIRFALPAFNLIDSTGGPFVREDLIGRVWIANSVFTRCPGPCARMTQQMAALHTLLQGAENVGFLTVTVDPDYDNPTVLTQYAGEARADMDRWKFVTGSKSAVYDFIRNGLRLVVEEIPVGEPAPEGPIVHSTKFILIDREGNVRGYYDGLDEAARVALVNDARDLAGL